MEEILFDQRVFFFHTLSGHWGKLDKTPSGGIVPALLIYLCYKPVLFTVTNLTLT